MKREAVMKAWSNVLLCAWLLWNAYVTYDSARNLERAIVAAFETKQDCEAAIPADIATSLRVWKSVYQTVQPVAGDATRIAAKGTTKDPEAFLLVWKSCWPVGVRPNAGLTGAEPYAGDGK
jgi:hypothetical protein